MHKKGRKFGRERERDSEKREKLIESVCVYSKIKITGIHNTLHMLNRFEQLVFRLFSK